MLTSAEPVAVYDAMCGDTGLCACRIIHGVAYHPGAGCGTDNCGHGALSGYTPFGHATHHIEYSLINIVLNRPCRFHRSPVFLIIVFVWVRVHSYNHTGNAGNRCRSNKPDLKDIMP